MVALRRVALRGKTRPDWPAEFRRPKVPARHETKFSISVAMFMHGLRASAADGAIFFTPQRRVFGRQQLGDIPRENGRFRFSSAT